MVDISDTTYDATFEKTVMLHYHILLKFNISISSQQRRSNVHPWGDTLKRFVLWMLML